MISVFRNARIVTMAGPDRPRVGSEMRELAIVEGSLSAWDGLFLDVGPDLGGDEITDLQGRLVVPGFVDAHTHLIFGGGRCGEFAARCAGATYESIAQSGGGIQSTVQATRSCTPEHLHSIARKHAYWMLSGGTTTVEAKSGYGLTLESELNLLRAIQYTTRNTPLRCVGTLLALHALPPEFEGNRSGYVAHVCEDMLAKVADERLAKYADAFVEPGYFTPEDARMLASAAKAYGLGLRLHVDQLTPSGGAELAAELGATTADHLEQTEQPGIDALAEAGPQPVLLPASVHCLGKRKYPRARAMIDAGLAVVLATDFNPGSSPTPSMAFVMNLACTQMGMTPTEALAACTINAAHSIGLGHLVGSIEMGKAADFVVLDATDPAEIPYWVGAPIVYKVYTQGKLAFSRDQEDSKC